MYFEGGGLSVDKIFVYGTLMSGMSNYHVIRPFIKTVKPAKMKGILYDLPLGYPAMVDGEGTVLGEIMESNDIESALAILDELEEYYGPGALGNEYIRVIREAECNGEKYNTFVYLWAKPMQLDELGILLTNGDWKTIMEK